MTSPSKHYLTYGNNLSSRATDKVRRMVRRCLVKFPDICEGVIMLDRVEHFFTCKVDGDFIVMNLLPRDKAEEILNKGGVSTIEPWSAWPGSEPKH
jgi:hypothetical protein